MIENVKREKLNRQAIRSRRMLQEALLTLLETMRFQKIRIKDITEQADLARPTFYAHFETKEDLLLSYVDDVLDRIFSELEKQPPSELKPEPERADDPPALLLNLFSFWKEHADALQLVRTADIDMQIKKRLREFHGRVYIVKAAKGIAHRPLDDYMLEVIAGVSSGLLLKWMDDGMKESPERMSRLMHAVINEETFARVEDQFDG